MKRLELVMSEALWGFWSAVGHSVRAAAEKVTFGRGTRLIVDSGETVTFSRYQNMFMYICLYVQLTMDSLCDKILQVNFKSHLVFSTSETDRSDLRQILWKQEKQIKKIKSKNTTLTKWSFRLCSDSGYLCKCYEPFSGFCTRVFACLEFWVFVEMFPVVWQPKRDRI